MANEMDEWQRRYNERLAVGNDPGSPAALEAEIERLRASLRSICNLGGSHDLRDAQIIAEAARLRSHQ